MSTDKLDQLFANTRDAEPYLSSEGFEEPLYERLDKLEWPPAWLRFGIPVFGAVIGIVCGLLILTSLGGPGYTSQLLQSLIASSLDMSIWSAGLVSLLFTAAGFLGAKQFVGKA